VVAVAVNAGDEMRLNPPLRYTQEQLARQKHQGRTFKILMQAKGVKPGAPAAGEAGGLRLMFAKRALPDGLTPVISSGLNEEAKGTTFATMGRAVAAELRRN
jgi:hypothetical protein